MLCGSADRQAGRSDGAAVVTSRGRAVLAEVARGELRAVVGAEHDQGVGRVRPTEADSCAPYSLGDLQRICERWVVVRDKGFEQDQVDDGKRTVICLAAPSAEAFDEALAAPARANQQLASALRRQRRLRWIDDDG